MNALGRVMLFMLVHLGRLFGLHLITTPGYLMFFKYSSGTAFAFSN